MQMPNAYDMVRWLHFLCAATAGGAMAACLLVSGFEDTREDLRGLAAALWARVVAWPLRLGALVGIGMVGWMYRVPDRWLIVKMVLALALVGVSEATPKALASGRRGGAMLALLLFLLATFTVGNRSVFAGRPAAPAVMAPAK